MNEYFVYYRWYLKYEMDDYFLLRIIFLVGYNDSTYVELS